MVTTVSGGEGVTVTVQNPRLAKIGKPLFRVTILSHDLSLNNTGWSSPFDFFQNFSQHSERM